MPGFIRKIKSLVSTIADYDRRMGAMQEALGRIEARQNRAEVGSRLNSHEFKVYSQWGEDGIIEFLTHNVEIKNKIFVEFGVGNYLEANTRFLLVNKNWFGLVMDADSMNVSFIKSDPIYWRHNLKAKHAFITKDNINELLERNGFTYSAKLKRLRNM